MTTSAQKKAKKQLGTYFIKKGKIYSQEEYIAAKDQPVMGSRIKVIYGNYARMVNHLKEDQALMALIAQSEAIQKEAKEPEEVIPSPTVSALEGLKAASNKLAPKATSRASKKEK